MTRLRKMMLEELQRRNYSAITTRNYLRVVYGWEWNQFSGRSNVVCRVSWRCRSCARLRYSSEGGYVRPGMMFRAFGNLPRPDLWLPYVFTSPPPIP